MKLQTRLRRVGFNQEFIFKKGGKRLKRLPQGAKPLTVSYVRSKF